MNIELPNRERLAEIFAGEANSPTLPEGYDYVEFMDIAMRALETAIKEYPLEAYRPIEEFLGDAPYYTVDPDLLKELNVPSVSLSLDPIGLPLLILIVFDKQGEWITSAACSLTKPTGFFIGKALALVRGLKQSGIDVSEEDERVFLVRKTANMLKMVFGKIKDRIEITAESFCDEVFWSWAELWYEDHAEFNSLQGFQMKRVDLTKTQGMQIKKHEEDISALWRDDSSETLSDLKKQYLALQYVSTLEHWKEMEGMQLDGKNWRRYVKAGDMSDIDDDLIEMFEKGNDVSGIAIEHAARRAEFFNIFNVKKHRLEKRKMGIKDSGYSRSRLFELKSEGEKMLEDKRLAESPTS